MRLSKIAAPLVLAAVVLLSAVACSSQPPVAAATPPPRPAQGTFVPISQPGNELNGDSGPQGSGIGSKNVSEINIDLSASSEPTQTFSFAIDRSRNQVRVIDLGTEASLQGTGDLLARLTVEVLDPAVLTAPAQNASQPAVGLVVYYDQEFVRVVPAGTENPFAEDAGAVISLAKLQQDAGAPRTARMQAEGGGVRATLEVEIFDSQEQNETGEPSSGVVFAQDKPEQPIDLSEDTAGNGTVVINVRVQGASQPVAVATPPQNEAPKEPETNPQSETSLESPSQPPEDNPQEPEDPDTSGGQPDPVPTQVSTPEPVPSESPQITTTPSPGNIQVPDPEGEPVGNNASILLVIDHSSSVRLTDNRNERLDAATAFLSASLPGDEVGLIHFGYGLELTRFVEINQSAGGRLSLVRFKEAINEEPAKIGVGGASNGGSALREACQKLQTQGTKPRKAIILLSDGQFDTQVSALLDTGPPHELCLATGYIIYWLVIGGLHQSDRISNAQQSNVLDMVEETGGDFAVVSDTELNSLVCETQRIRPMFMGVSSQPCIKTTTLRKDQSTPTIRVTVPPGQLQATFSFSWTGDKVSTTITPPGSSTMVPIRSSFAPGALHDTGDSFEAFTVINPPPGTWEIQVAYKDDEPETGISDVVIGFTTIPSGSAP